MASSNAVPDIGSRVPDPLVVAVVTYPVWPRDPTVEHPAEDGQTVP